MSILAHTPITETGDSTITPEQYDTIIGKLEAAGAGAPAGRLHHAAYSNGADRVGIIDVWASPEDLEAFAAVLVPILIEVGIAPSEPQISPIHNTINGC